MGAEGAILLRVNFKNDKKTVVDVRNEPYTGFLMVQLSFITPV